MSQSDNQPKKCPRCGGNGFISRRTHDDPKVYGEIKACPECGAKKKEPRFKSFDEAYEAGKKQALRVFAQPSKEPKEEKVSSLFSREQIENAAKEANRVQKEYMDKHAPKKDTPTYDREGNKHLSKEDIKDAAKEVTPISPSREAPHELEDYFTKWEDEKDRPHIEGGTREKDLDDLISRKQKEGIREFLLRSRVHELLGYLETAENMVDYEDGDRRSWARGIKNYTQSIEDELTNLDDQK